MESLILKPVWILLVFLVLFCDSVISEVCLPPEITAQPESAIYRNEDTITMVCEAQGVPSVEFYWTKNGEVMEFDIFNIERIPLSVGSFTLGPLSSLDDGYYQCFAANSYGVAVSQVAHLQLAMLARPHNFNIQEYHVNQGHSLKLVCDPSRSYPPPHILWTVSDTLDDKNPQLVELDMRVQQDTNGNLYFSNLLTTDYPNKIYKCMVYNPIIEMTTGSSYSRIFIQPEDHGGLQPTGLFSTQSPVIGLRGQEVELQCMFAGYPTPQIKWSRIGGSLPSGRFHQINYNTLVIIELMEEDEGEYMCSGENSEGAHEVVLHLHVESVPVFNSPFSHPHNVNKTNGDSVSFLCESYGVPEPYIEWYINGEALNPDYPGSRRSISKDYTNLTITDLCKDCGNDTTDLMVVQCNSSNEHGYAYSEGYLNVLLKTIITVEPNDIIMKCCDTTAVIPCEATSDESTPVLVTWYFNDVIIDQEMSWYNVSPGGLEVIPKENNDPFSVEGKYTCHATNGISVSSRTVYLYITDTPCTTIKTD